VASLADDPGGRRRILFFNARHERKVLRLGRVDRHWAETARGHIEKLADAAIVNSTPPPETSAWVAALPDVLRRRFAAVGLAAAPAQEAALKLRAFLDDYRAARAVALKPRTQTVLAGAARCMLEHFGPDRPLDSITPGDVDEFRLYLLKKGLAPTTISRRIAVCKTVFAFARRKRLIAESPFADVKTGCMVNAARQVYIDRATVEKVLAACPPDSDLRLIVALARYGGLRVPSEVMPLRWGDIHWGENDFTVHSPKTERHPGHESRLVPLFADLRPLLQAAFEAAPEGSEFVIRNRRLSNAYLTKLLRHVLQQASTERWPRLWQNLRSSLATDLAEDFAPFLAARWCGHSLAIANSHYWTTRRTDIDRAATWTPKSAAEKAAQNAAHSGAIPDSQALSGDQQVAAVIAPDNTGQYVKVSEYKPGGYALTPTWTLRKRAGATPWPTRAV